MKKRILVTGITGMDGSIIAEKLLAQNNEVHGVIRRSSNFNTARIEHIYNHPDLHLHYGDVCDGSSLRRILLIAAPDIVFHLAAQSHVRVSFDMPEFTADVTALGTLRLLESIRELDLNPKIYNACSSEIFGSTPAPQGETTTIHPRSPYGASKAFAFHIAQHYKEAYDLFIANGILFNHTHTSQAETFVTRKITRAVGRIKLGLQKKLFLGNLDAKRDIGWAPDYVDAMMLMIAKETPEDFVVGTGYSKSIKDIANAAFTAVGLNYANYIDIDPRFYRATEVDHLEADWSKAAKQLNWKPTKSFEDIISTMVLHDLELARREKNDNLSA